MARELQIPETSFYLDVGFCRDNDIRTVVLFGIPFGSLHMFKTATEYRFSVKGCREAMADDRSIFAL